MPGVVLFGIAVLLMLIEGVVLSALSVQVWALQTPLVVVVYLALQRDFAVGGGILVAAMLPVEWMVAGVPGVYSAGLAVMYGGLYVVRNNLQPVWGFARGAAAAMGALVHGFVVLLVLFLLGEGSGRLASAAARQMWVAAPLVGVASVVAGKTFARLDEMMDPRSSDTGLEHEL